MVQAGDDDGVVFFDLRCQHAAEHESQAGHVGSKNDFLTAGRPQEVRRSLSGLVDDGIGGYGGLESPTMVGI